MKLLLCQQKVDGVKPSLPGKRRQAAALQNASPILNILSKLSPVRADIVAIMGLAYCLHFTFMGRLADLMQGFMGPFVISAGVLVALIIWLKSRDAGILITRIQDAVAFAIFAVLYPLIIVDSDLTDLWMQYLYVFMLLYACVLLVCCRYRMKKSAGAIYDPEDGLGVGA